MTNSAPSPIASPSAKPTKLPAAPSQRSTPGLTKEQQALNRQAKETFKNSTASVDTFVEMQVAIAEGVSTLSLTSGNDAQLSDKDGKSLRTLPKGTPITIEAAGDGIQFGSRRLPAIVWMDSGINGTFVLNDRSYRGQLLIAVDANGKLWAVNTINLRQYLYSVVGAEVSPSWGMEALKAQSVAARSYALTYYFRPMSPLFHLGATEYYQVYKGIESEADRTRQAVDATAGQYVSYKGGVVESLYAASDDIVAEAFQGQGMSQLGARDLAEKGYAYEQILKYYYPGTAVGRIKKFYE